MTWKLALLLALLAQPAHADGLTGKTVKDTYGDLLQMSNGNAGLASSLRPVLDGKGNASVLSLSTGAVQLSGPLAFSGVFHPGLTLNKLTSVQRDALAPSAGMLIFNTTTGRAENYNGTAWVGANGGSVTSLALSVGNGITSSLSNPSSTPAVTLGLGDITPNSVAAAGSVTGSNLSGTNTGDQTITLTGAVTGTGTAGIPTTIANSAVTAPKLFAGAAASNVGTLGGDLSGTLPNPSVAPAAVDSTKLAAGACATNVGTLGGDLSGTLPNPAVLKINGLTPATVATSGSYTDLANRPTLGTAAAQSSSAFATATQGTKADGALQASSNLSDLASPSAARTNLGLAIGTNVLAPNGSGASLTGLTGSQITGNIAGNAANVTGTVAVANGGSGQATANAALNAFLPAQSGNAAKFLKSDGMNTSWAPSIPTTTWASIPSASAAGANAFEYVTDVGVNGCLFESTGTTWRPASGVCVLWASATASSVTGTTTETTLATVTIPAGLMTANAQLRITSLWSFNSSANTKSARVKFGGNTYLSNSNTTNIAGQFYTQVRNRGVTNSQIGFSSGSAAGFGAISTANATSAVDTTAATSVTFTALNGQTTETTTLEGGDVELIIP